MGVYPWIYRLISRLEFKQSSDYIIDYTSSKFAARQRAIEQGKPLPETPDFCTKFFLAHEKSPETFSPLHVLAGAGANISAGSETTSIALVSILYHLISHPKKLEQLRDELEAAEATGGISRPITFAQSQLLEYFQAVVKEAMRLHPSAALPFWRIVPPEGATIAGQFFQAGVSPSGCPLHLMYPSDSCFVHSPWSELILGSRTTTRTSSDKMQTIFDRSAGWRPRLKQPP